MRLLVRKHVRVKLYCILLYKAIFFKFLSKSANKEYTLNAHFVNNLMQFACSNSRLLWKYQHVGSCMGGRRDKHIYFGKFDKQSDVCFQQMARSKRILFCPNIALSQN